MSGIAHLFLSRGMKVSGSDLKESQITQDLKKMGAQVFIGHDASQVADDVDTVVYSSAIKEDNPEIQEAKRRGIVLLKRAQALAELMKDKTVITVTGSHGKTTTTSLASLLLLEAGFCPTAAIGGIVRNMDSNACLGKSAFFVAEADESDGSFLYYLPKYSIITNIDYEHLDHYGDFQNEVNTFREFINRTDSNGCVFGCGDDDSLRSILKDYKHRYLLFGLTEDSHIYPGDIRLNGLNSEFSCFYKNKFLDRFQLALGGEHNISNSLAVIALGLELGINLDIIKETLKNFQGARRRIEIKFESPQYLLIDDYAHHPTEIKATLKTVKDIKSDRIVAVFQPHRYTRTKFLLNEFAASFNLADYIIITEIYPASEPPIEGISGELLFHNIREQLPKDKEVVFLPKDQIVEHILKIIRPHDLIIILGAGDIVKVGDELVERLKG